MCYTMSMNKSKITIEYDECCKQKQIQKKVKRPNGRFMMQREMVPVKDPRCWEVSTAENTLEFTPGQRLTKKQMESLCRGVNYDVQIGMPGQFRITGSRY